MRLYSEVLVFIKMNYRRNKFKMKIMSIIGKPDGDDEYNALIHVNGGHKRIDQLLNIFI